MNSDRDRLSLYDRILDRIFDILMFILVFGSSYALIVYIMLAMIVLYHLSSIAFWAILAIILTTIVLTYLVRNRRSINE